MTKFSPKEFFKKISASSIVQKIAAWIIHIYVVFVYKSSRVILRTREKEIEKLLNDGNGMILFCWHGRTIITPPAMRVVFKKYLKNKRINLLSSIHRDGKIVAEISRTFGFEVLEGSTIDPKKGASKNKKSLTSLRTMLRKFKNGEICVLGIDGPRGPLHKINTKVTEIVKMTETPMVSVAVSFKRKIQFRTWDEFQLPAPFNKIIIEFGKPVIVGKDEDYEKINRRFEDELNGLTKKNDEEILK